MLRIFFTAIISVFILCGCNSKPFQEEISFSSWGSVTEVQILKKIIKEFESENPDIKINFIHIPQNYFQKLHLLFASNNAPDVIFINNIYLPLYESHLEDLSEKIDKTAYYSQAVNCLSYNQKLLAIPRDISNLVLYINSDIIPETQKIESMEDLISIAKNVTSKNRWGISYEEDIYWAIPYLSYYGEEINQDFNPKNSKGLNFYIDLGRKHHIAPTKSEVGSATQAQMFLDKKLGIYLSGRWIYPKIKEKADFNWRINEFPRGENPLPCDSSGWAISKQSKHKGSALRFIQYLSNSKSAKYFTNTGLIVPARKDSTYLLQNKSHNEYIFLEAIKNSENILIDKDYKKITDKINSQF